METKASHRPGDQRAWRSGNPPAAQKSSAFLYGGVAGAGRPGRVWDPGRGWPAPAELAGGGLPERHALWVRRAGGGWPCAGDRNARDPSSEHAASRNGPLSTSKEPSGAPGGHPALGCGFEGAWSDRGVPPRERRGGRLVPAEGLPVIGAMGPQCARPLIRARRVAERPPRSRGPTR